MKFISKSSNLMVVLKPGLPGNSMLGTSAVNGIYARFQQGVLESKDQVVIDLLLKHPAYNLDFVSAEDDALDPYAHMRDEIEPKHVISEVNYGHVEKSVGTANTKPMDPKLKAYLHAEAMKMAKELLPGLLKEVLDAAKAATPETKDEVVDTSPKKAAGRPPKNGTNDIIKEETETPAV